MVDVAVVILTCNQREVTLRCLSSFEDVDQDGIEILVWDNGSKDGTKETIEERFPDVAVRRSDQNLGAAGGRNAGAKTAKELWDPKFLLFLDNDTVVTKGFISCLQKPFKESSSIGITTPKILQLDNPERIDVAGGCRVQFHLGQTPTIGYDEIDRGQYDYKCDCVPGSTAILVRRDVFGLIEGFDTDYDPYGLEDIDFSLRVKEAGFRCLYVPDAVVYHKGTQTFEEGEYSRHYARQKAKNWYRFVQKHANPFEKAAFWLVGVPLRLLGAAVREVRRGNVGAVAGLVTGGLRTVFGKNKEK